MTQENKHTLNGNSIAFPLFILIVIGGFFLWREEGVDIVFVLPVLILLLYPFIPMLMHHEHGYKKGVQDDHDNHRGGSP